MQRPHVPAPTRRRRTPGLPALLGGLLVLGSACRSPEAPAPDAGGGRKDMAPATSPTPAEGMRLVRCAYRPEARGPVHRIATDERLGAALAERLEAAVRPLREAGGPEESPGDWPDGAVRGWEIRLEAGPEEPGARAVPGSGAPWPLWLEVLEVEGAGSFPLRLRWADGRVATGELDPETAATRDELRGRALLALLDDGPPLRPPLAWHIAALADCIGTGAAAWARSVRPGAPDAPALRAEVIGRLSRSPHPGPAARVVLGRLEEFSAEEVAPLVDARKVEARLVPLARDALDGRREALREILVLAVEYSGPVETFDRALRTLFPPSANPALHRRHPAETPAGRLGFLQALRARFDAVRYDDDNGHWRLP